MPRLSSPSNRPAKWIALILTFLVHGALVLFLFFGVQWQRHATEPVSVALVNLTPTPVTPAQITPPLTSPVPPPVEQPKPTTPEPAAPSPAQIPHPVAPPKPENVTPKAPKPDIEIKQPEKPKKPEPPKPTPKPEPQKSAPKPTPPKPEKPKVDPKIQQAEKELLRKQEAARNQALLNKETRRADLNRQQALLNQEGSHQAEAEAAERINAASTEWGDKIRAKVKSNIVLPPNISGRPKAKFQIKLLPTGEVMETKLLHSSGNKVLDDAIERAIIKSSPLPMPSTKEAFERELTLLFDPMGS